MSPVTGSEKARELVNRVRALLPAQPTREVRMFGAVAVMVDDSMAVAVNKDGSLLVRVDPAEDADLLEKPYASRAEMGTGRSMGQGWIRVEAEGLRSDQDLRDWVGCATRYLSRRSLMS